MLGAAAMKKRTQAGSILLEGLIAILIFSVGILALIGLQATSMKNTTQAKVRIDASLIASQRLGQIWVDIPGLAGYAEENTSVAELPNGTRTTTIAGNQVTVLVTWQMPGSDEVNSYKTIAQINTNP
jgi:type IV pilus assembly protein PilV